MHRKEQLAVVVHRHIFPNPRAEDPTSFSMHLSKNLVGEVRIETATFYGSLDSVEARYPGLNYSHPPHRKRLGRFPHHARLFKAFDDLGLTPSEIAGFCRWEGTLWARERYERDEGIKVVDTTAQEIGPWVDHRHRKSQKSGINVKTDIEVEIVPAQSPEEPEDETMEDEEEEDEAVDDVETVQLARQEARRIVTPQMEAAQRAAWEEYVKEQQESERDRRNREAIRSRAVFRRSVNSPPTAAS